MDRVFEVVEINPEAEFGCDEGERELVALVTRTKDQEKHVLTYADKFKFVYKMKIVRVIHALIMRCSHEVGLSVYCMSWLARKRCFKNLCVCTCIMPAKRASDNGAPHRFG